MKLALLIRILLSLRSVFAARASREAEILGLWLRLFRLLRSREKWSLPS
jgi:hypothetical protein